MKTLTRNGRLSLVSESSLPRELVAFLMGIVGLWGLSLLNALRLSRSVGIDRAFDVMYFPNPLFDLLCYVGRVNLLHHAEFFTAPGFSWNYPAPCIFVYKFLYRSVAWTHGLATVLFLYDFTVAILLLVAGYKLAQALMDRGLSRVRSIVFVGTSILFSWPIYFALQRGNIEAVLSVGLAASIYAYIRERWMLAAVLLGVIAAFKIYPILCFGLFLWPRRYREMVIGLLTGLVTTLLALVYIGPTLPIAAKGTAQGIKKFVQLYSSVYDPLAIGYDHSAFSLVKVLSLGHTGSIPGYLPRYTLIAGLIAAVLFFSRTWKMPRPNQVMMLVVMAVLLPSTSFDYTLESLYIPWAWIASLVVSAHSSGREIRGGVAAMICFGLIFGPETFLVHGGTLFAGQLKAVALLCLLVISLIFRFEERTSTPALAS